MVVHGITPPKSTCTSLTDGVGIPATIKSACSPFWNFIRWERCNSVKCGNTHYVKWRSTHTAGLMPVSFAAIVFTVRLVSKRKMLCGPTNAHLTAIYIHSNDYASKLFIYGTERKYTVEHH